MDLFYNYNHILKEPEGCISVPTAQDPQFCGSVTSEELLLYNYKNLTRTAIVINRAWRKNEANHVNTTFETYISSFTNAATLNFTFIDKFESILLDYMKLRFPNIEMMMIAETSDPGIDHFPVNTWIEHGVLFCAYSKKNLERLINKFSAILLVGSKNFVPNDDLYMQKSDMVVKTEYILKSQQIIEQHVKKTPRFHGYAYSDKYEYFDPMQNSGSLQKRVINERCREDVQTNIKDIWATKNDIALTSLTVISEILEIIIRPVIGQFLGARVPVGKIKVAFPMESTQEFTFTNVKPLVDE